MILTKNLSSMRMKLVGFGFSRYGRIRPEANGAWFPWSAVWNGGAEKRHYGDIGIPDGPELAFGMRIVISSLYSAEGAVNVTWVFHLASAPAG